MPDAEKGLPTETLRVAAALMRAEHGPEHERHAMWAAMADLLEGARCSLHCGPSGKRERYCSACEDSTYDHECPAAVVCEHSAPFRHALAVADAYLAATRPLPPAETDTPLTERAARAVADLFIADAERRGLTRPLPPGAPS